MRALLLLLWLVASSAWASAIPVSLPANLTSVAGGIATNGAVSMAGGSAAVTLTTQVEGQMVRIPAVMRMAANAGQVGVAAMRINPAGMIASSILSYMIQYGIQKCADGTWCHTQPSSVPAGQIDPTSTGWGNVSTDRSECYQSTSCTAQQACDVYMIGQPPGNTISIVQIGPSVATCTIVTASGQSFGVGNIAKASPYTPPPGTPVPATDADWSKVPTMGWPDQMTDDLSAVPGVQLPVTVTPSVDHVDVPLGSPATDPVTGNRYQTNARVTPNQNDPRTADLTVTKQPVDANGNPATDPTTGAPKPPEKPTDPCDGHESRVGCMDAGSAPDPEAITENKINVNVTPDGGWGPDNGSCPMGTFSVRGFSFSTPWGPVCSFATMIRPLVIAFAWLAAALIVVGIGQKGGE